MRGAGLIFPESSLSDYWVGRVTPDPALSVIIDIWRLVLT